MKSVTYISSLSVTGGIFVYILHILALLVLMLMLLFEFQGR